MREYDFEPIPGLPERLPPGEEVLWQGSPSWKAMARRAFHVRKVAIYFAILAVLAIAVDASDGLTLISLVKGLTWILFLALLTIGLLTLLAWSMARSSIYTITNRRVVMRIGAALPMMVNLPFKQIQAADLCIHDDGTGDIALRMDPSAKLSYILFWPHVRPWQFSPPQPMLRTIPEPKVVAEILAKALNEFQGTAGQPAETSAAPAEDPSSSAVRLET